MSEACETCGKDFDPDMRIDREEFCQCPDMDYIFDNLEEDELAAVQSLEKENQALRHDIERHVAITSEQATELSTLRAELDRERGRSLVLTARELRDALSYMNPDEGDAEQLETEAELFYRATEQTSTDGDPLPIGWYCYLMDCPEEGCYGPLGIDTYCEALDTKEVRGE